MTLSPTDRLTWTTPTARAEAVYQAEQAKRPRRVLIGPSGLVIPWAGKLFNRAQDGRLLHQIMTAALADFRSRELPRASTEAAADALAADLRDRYPAADMAVLQRYGFAWTKDRVVVEFGGARGSAIVPLALPVLVPGTCPHHAYQPDGAARSKALPVPSATEPYFARVAAVESAERDEFRAATSWPALFAVRHHRQPSWGDIAEAWPRIGAWMVDQRATAQPRMRSAA